MATVHDKDSLLQLCSRANQLGNTISTRMVQFLGEVKHQPVGFRELGNEFLDICRIMASIEVGLGEFLKSNSGQFPSDVLAELDRKFRQTVEDFLVLHQLLQKFLDYEKGGAVARVQKTWRMVFADKDIAKVRNSLQGNREALKMSMLVFSWSPNYQTILVAPEQRDLAAKLERPLSVTDTVSSLSSFTPSEMEGTTARDQGVAELDDATVSIAELDDTEVPVAELDGMAISPPPTESLHPQQSNEASSLAAQNNLSDVEPTTLPAPEEPGRDLVATPDILQKVTTKEEPASSTDKPTEADEALPNPSPMPAKKLKRLPVVKADPSTMKRRQPTNPQKTNPPSLQNALISAIQGGKHKIVEQLLNRGVSPNTSPKSALFEATRNQDLLSMTLLLEFGADPNFIPDDGKDKTQIPLCYTADRDFADGAALLLAYGAKPDVRNVWDQVPLFLVTTWNRPKTATKLLEYGADPNLAAPELPLLQAIPHEDCACLEALLAYGADPAPIKTILVRAAERNNTAAVDLLVDHGADVNQQMDDYYKWTPLTTAIRHNRVDFAAALLARGADPTRRGEDPPIFVAAGKPEMLKLLMVAGADIHDPPGIAEKAVLSGNLEALEWLLDVHKVDANASVDGVHRALGAAVRHNKPDAVRVLLDRGGADPNLKAGADLPLLEAAHCGSAEVITLLIRAGAEIDSRPASAAGRSALTTALYWGHADAVKALLDAGADPNLRGDGLPLEQALLRPPLVRMLLDAGADAKQKQGPGLVELAAQRGVLESVKLLVAAGADVEEQRESWGKQRALATAVREGRDEIVRWLVREAKADVNAPGAALPLVLAVRRSPNDGVATVEFLLDNGADFNLQHDGWNAVMEATDRNMVDLVKMFIDRGGVNLELTDNAGRTALDMAANQGHDDLVGILLEAM